MLMNNKSQIPGFKFQVGKIGLSALLLIFGALFISGCRYDMQDQPRYKYYKRSEFFQNEMGSRPLVDGTVARGYLRDDKALYTGKKDGAAVAPNTLSSDGGKQQTADGSNAQLTNVAPAATVSYPDDVAEFPLPVTAELINRGEQRYRVFCIVCHGPNGDGNGMIARRGYQGVKTYHSDELRDAPVGHLYDVVTNGWGRMNGYAAQIPVKDRWAIVAYIRTLQTAQNPDVIKTMPINTGTEANQPSATHDGGHH